MKDILEIAFKGECKAPVAEVERKHYFCAAPTDGKTYCDECGRRMFNPTRHFVDSQGIADSLGGGRSKPVNPRERGGSEDHLVSVDGYLRGANAALGNRRIRDEARSEAFVRQLRVVA